MGNVAVSVAFESGGTIRGLSSGAGGYARTGHEASESVFKERLKEGRKALTDGFRESGIRR